MLFWMAYHSSNHYLEYFDSPFQTPYVWTRKKKSFKVPLMKASANLAFFLYVCSIFTAGEWQLVLTKESRDVQSAFSRLFLKCGERVHLGYRAFQKVFVRRLRDNSCKPGKVRDKIRLWYRSNVRLKLLLGSWWCFHVWKICHCHPSLNSWQGCRTSNLQAGSWGGQEMMAVKQL